MFSSIIVVLLAGWCGTEPRILPPVKIDFPPKPPVTCKVCLAIGSFGGFVLAYAATNGFAGDGSLLTTTALGFVGGRVASNVYTLVTG